MMKAYKTVMKGPWAYLELLIVSLAVFVLLIMVPVLTTPGNSFFFQLSILETDVLIVMILLSIFNALLIKMQLYIRKTVKEKKKLHQKAGEGATLIGIVMSSLAATVACAACYSTVFAFIGLGATTFIVEHRIWITLIALALTLVAIYYSARRINNHCAVCSI